MATAKNETITEETTCPAAAMAALVGSFMRINNELDEMKVEEDDQSLKERGTLGALEMATAGIEALAMVPAQSLAGAVAKMVAALHFLDLIAHDEISNREGARRKFLSDALFEDAMTYFNRDHGITLQGIGLDAYSVPGPLETMRAAQALLKGRGA